MSRITMRVTVHNESNALLILQGSNHESGSFTKGQSPPKQIKANETKSFQSEGSSILNGPPTTGVEGTVRYQIKGGQNDGQMVVVSWNSPLVESDYDNTFGTTCPPGWEITHWGGQGHNGQLHARLRKTAPRMIPRFHPHGRGFAFSNNDWDKSLPVISVGFLWNKLLEAMPEPLRLALQIAPFSENDLPLTHANEGMCGGMVFAVLDYFYAHLLPPNTVESPKTADDPLFLYIRERLWDSFDVSGQGHRFLSYSSPHYPDSSGGIAQDFGYGKGRSWITYRETWQFIHLEIDAGRPVPLNLIQTKDLDIGKNHQVLAYGYQRSGQKVTLYIYDPNEPQADTVTYTFDISSTSGAVNITRSPANTTAIYCIFAIGNYQPRLPPSGRPIVSVRDSILATKGRNAKSLRQTMSETQFVGRSVKQWLQAL